MKNSYAIIIICLIGGFIWGSRSNSSKKRLQPQMVENQHYEAGEVDALANQLHQMWLTEESRRNEEETRRREQANKRFDEIQRLMQKTTELNRYQYNTTPQTSNRQWQPPERQPTYYWVCRYCGHEIFIGQIPQGRMPNPPLRGNRCLRQPTEGGFRNCVYDKVQR